MHRTALGILALLILPAPLRASPIQVAGGHARIPFQMMGGHIWVQGVVNKTDSVWVVIDTGASGSVMDGALAKRLELKTHGTRESRGSGGVQTSVVVSDVTLQIAGIEARFETLDSIDLRSINPGGRHPMQFVLGYELFKACVVRFDYPGGMIDVWDNSHAPQTASGIHVALTFIEHHPYVDGVLRLPGREPFRGRFEIDTGSNAPLVLAPQDDSRQSAAESFSRTLEMVSRGVGGETPNRIGRGESFEIGELRFDKPLVMVPDPKGTFNAPGTLGNIGGQLLGRCRVTFDYSHKTVAFERGEGFERPFEADMSGLAMIRDPEGLKVRIVNPGTPAAEAGMEPGDVVTRIEGNQAASIDPGTLRTLFQQDGKKLAIEYRRGRTTRTATLVLRRLI